MSEGMQIAQLEDLGLTITGKDASPLVQAINEYLAIFAKPVVSDREPNMMFGAVDCLKCGKPLTGICGTFQWGIANGEGFCANCGWPCRALHRPKDNDGYIFDRALERVLQYHPDTVTTNKDSNR